MSYNAVLRYVIYADRIRLKNELDLREMYYLCDEPQLSLISEKIPYGQLALISGHSKHMGDWEQNLLLTLLLKWQHFVSSYMNWFSLLTAFCHELQFKTSQFLTISLSKAFIQGRGVRLLLPRAQHRLIVWVSLPYLMHDWKSSPREYDEPLFAIAVISEKMKQWVSLRVQSPQPTNIPFDFLSEEGSRIPL